MLLKSQKHCINEMEPSFTYCSATHHPAFLLRWGKSLGDTGIERKVGNATSAGVAEMGFDEMVQYSQGSKGRSVIKENREDRPILRSLRLFLLSSGT